MKKIIKGSLIFTLLLLLFSACYNDNEYDLYPFPSTSCDTIEVTYSKSIVPILTTNCIVCHSTAVHEGNVILDTYEGASTVALNGMLWGGVNWENGFVPMPKGKSKLPDCDLAKIRIWIKQGAPNN
jgi:hypothetical protein